METPTPLEIAIRAMKKVRDTRMPGIVRDGMDKMIDIAMSHTELDPIVASEIYAQGFRDAMKIKNP